VPTISRLESGQHRPNVETLQKLARAFDRQLVVGFVDPAYGASQQPLLARITDRDAEIVTLA
jgi:transcriptional regulator with XRE-family HTH domain